jgi:chromosome segregation ATPase
MTRESMALLIHFGERSVFVVAGLLCLWLGYRLLDATSEFSKWPEQATSNVQSAIDILKRAIAEAKQTLERISEAEEKARTERTVLERAKLTKLQKVSQDNEASTTEAMRSVDREWKEGFSKKLDETCDKIENMNTVSKMLKRRLNLCRYSSAVLGVIGTLLLIYAAFGVFPNSVSG